MSKLSVRFTRPPQAFCVSNGVGLIRSVSRRAIGSLPFFAALCGFKKFSALFAIANFSRLWKWKGVAIYAVRLLAVLRSVDVDGLRHKFQVGRVAAASVAAQVIKLGAGASIESTREWSNKPCVDNSVRYFNLPKEANHAVAADDGSSPVPAVSVSVYGNLREESSDCRGVQFGDGEILCGSHASASSADVWLEPFGAVTRSSGSFYFTPCFGVSI